ncbi:hypothetical protein [Sanguibacteroides justesenii]|uniref:hypothetical protein n=1 Tax=Sanguibacteroides justesenii TaxID=1547597 RepID=UPI0006964294|nr:hypothetical protein [Sanguibacteroides justesenii]
MDFTLKIYRELLVTLQNKGYRFLRYEDYCIEERSLLVDGKSRLWVILRHDVDELPSNALKMAKIENGLGIKATYYFRTVKHSNNPEVIRTIARLGHEIGYHYEDLALAKGNVELAQQSFKENLEYFRSFYPVKTVCMHGSSTSEYDNRLLWGDCSFGDFDLLGEPYLTTDFEKIFYLTDTGYAWDGGKYAVRDIVENKFELKFHSTRDIINTVQKGDFPDRIFILAHTLWTDRFWLWVSLHVREFVRNRIKNIARKNIIVKRFYSFLVNLYWKS